MDQGTIGTPGTPGTAGTAGTPGTQVHKYETKEIISKWVEGRIEKRLETYAQFPDYVVVWAEWVDKVALHSACTPGECPAPPPVTEWISNTIDDPDWPTPTP